MCDYGTIVDRSPRPWRVFGVVVLLAVLAVLTVSLITGCTPEDYHIPNSTGNVGGAVENAKNHIDSADSLVQKAKPESNRTGQALLGAASDEHRKAEAALDQAKQQLVQVQKERDELTQAIHQRDGTIKSRDAEIAAVKHGWGYRLQVLVARLFVILCILVGLHFAAGIAAIFVAGPVASGVLKWVGAIVNPLAWVQFAVDHIHLNRCKQDASAAISSVASAALNTGNVVNGAARNLEQIVVPRVN